jgi:hypothetical protein
MAVVQQPQDTCASMGFLKNINNSNSQGAEAAKIVNSLLSK